MKNSIILLFSFCFLILFNSCKTEPAISNATLLEFNNILEQNIEIHRDRFFKIADEIRHDLYEPRKYKYEFLLKAANKAIWKYDVFVEEYQTKVDSIHQYYSNANLDYKKRFLRNNSIILSTIDQSMIATYDSLLTEKYKIIGLRYDEMKKRLEGIRKDFSKIDSALIVDLSNDLVRSDVFNLKLKSLKYAAIHKAIFFAERMREMAGGKMYCSPNWIFPIVQPKRNSIKKGEFFEADIYVGNYPSFYPTQEPKVIIKGDTLNFDKDKNFIPFKYLPKQRGEEKLNFEFMIYNSLTGENYTTKSEYTLYVN